MERRLSAIMAADVVGYSRMMGEDEAGTLAALKALRAEFIDPTIAEHRGRIVKLIGDGVSVAPAGGPGRVPVIAIVSQKNKYYKYENQYNRSILGTVGITKT